jgi:maltose 6'-phosphate phosphatase
MKLLTLNTHSLVEENYEQKLQDFAEAVSKERPDIIALQEVNQTASEDAVPECDLNGYFPADKNTVIRRDNHVYRLVRILAEKGIYYSWTWLPLKLGYDKYDEGIAVMSMSPIADVKAPLVSGINDYYNWKTRKLLGVCTKDAPDEWFYSVHFGWWDDPDEPFQNQWARTSQHMLCHSKVWLMGDFNSPAEVRDEGYDMIVRDCWHDSYMLAEHKDSGITVGHVIDGWRDKIHSGTGMRIDHIWCSEKADVKSSEVLFNRINYPVVSDHYGVMIETR